MKNARPAYIVSEPLYQPNNRMPHLRDPRRSCVLIHSDARRSLQRPAGIIDPSSACPEEPCPQRTCDPWIAGASRSFERALLGFGIGFRALIRALLFAWLLDASRSFGVPADPQAFDAVQPDGTAIRLVAKGDEVLNWTEDLAGFPVVLSAGRWVYARIDAGNTLVPTSVAVGTASPMAAGLQPGKRPVVTTAERESWAYGPAGTAPSTPQSGTFKRGTLKNLVILCAFADQASPLQGRQAGEYSTLYNATAGHPVIAPSGSVRDYFKEVSYGNLVVDSTVVGWVTLPHPEAYYANGKGGTATTYPRNAMGMVEDALKSADRLVNFANFDSDGNGYVDSVTVVHSGYGAEHGGFKNRIWSHKWNLWALPGGTFVSEDRSVRGTPVRVDSYMTVPALWRTSGNEISRIGVVCHELGHLVLGLPDLYDLDGSGSGCGSYCLMANSWGFDFSQRYPPHLSAWSKIAVGWVTPKDLRPGTTTLAPAATHAEIYRSREGFPSGEYLLVENRQPFGFDRKLPRGGVAIWHIDESAGGNSNEGYPGQPGWPCNGTHYRVALLQSDGRYELERGANRGDASDLYGTSATSISPDSLPSTDSYRSGVCADTGIKISRIAVSGATASLAYERSSGQPAVWVDVNVPGLPSGAGLGRIWVRNRNEAYVWGAAGGSTPSAWVYGWDGSRWRQILSLPGYSSGALYGVGSSELLASADKDGQSALYRSIDNGKSWTRQNLPSELGSHSILEISGTPDNLHVNAGPHIFRFDGRSWSKAFSDMTYHVYRQTLLSKNEGYYVNCWGWGKWDGNQWRFNGRQFDFCDIYGLWGMREPNGRLVLYAVGNNNFSNGIRVWKFDETKGSFGSKMGFVFSDGNGYNVGSANGIWGSSDADIYVIGGLANTSNGTRSGRVYRFDGRVWNRLFSSETLAHPSGIAGTAADDVWIAFRDGRLRRFTRGVSGQLPALAFREAATSVANDPTPLRQIRIGDCCTELTWSAADEDAVAETAVQLEGPWTVAPYPIATEDGVRRMTVPVTDPARFFRLRPAALDSTITREIEEPTPAATSPSGR